MKREFLMLASKYDPKKHSPAGMMMSEKLDGVRCLWDGGISRGLACSAVPYANVEKHGRYVTPPMATGLWTRYGQSIQAPDWFLDQLPQQYLLDGELTIGRGQFQDTLSCVRSLNPTVAWRSICYQIFDAPSFATIFADGRMTNVNFKKTFSGIIDWTQTRHAVSIPPNSSFSYRYSWLKGLIAPNDYLQVLPQVALPVQRPRAVEQMDAHLDGILRVGGEGLMLRNQNSLWEPVRSKMLLKVKGMSDMEGTVIGYRWGDAGVGTKLVGLMGSLRLRLDSGVEFDLSGFTDAERSLSYASNSDSTSITISSYGEARQGCVVDTRVVVNPMFPMGSRVTFQYRELTLDGKPKEARYWRKHVVEL